jgi:glucokinase
MEARARKLVADGRTTILFDLIEHKGRDRLTSGVFAAALEDGDEVARELIDDAVWALGVGLASAQNLLDMEGIVIGGGLGDRLGEPFIDRVRDSMHPHLFVPDRAPEVLGTELRDLSGAVGAAVFAGG